MQSLTPCSVGFSRTPCVHHAHHLWPIGTRSDAASQLLPGQNALSAGAQRLGGRGIKFAPVARDYLSINGSGGERGLDRWSACALRGPAGGRDPRSRPTAI